MHFLQAFYSKSDLAADDIEKMRDEAIELLDRSLRGGFADASLVLAEVYQKRGRAGDGQRAVQALSIARKVIMSTIT